VTAAAAYDDSRARRNALILAAAQACYGSATTILIATAGLVGTQLAPSMAWATLPVSTFVIGTALTTMPVSLLMKRIGRRAGFILGAAAGLAGALLAVTAIFMRNFPLFVFATMFQGVFQASASYYRFAAADLASPAFRPKAISWVLTGGVAAALFGTLIVMVTADLFAPVIFAGSYAAMALICVVAIVILLFLESHKVEEAAVAADAGRPLAEIAMQPRFAAPMVVGMLSYGMMNLVMTATPVAMLGCGFNVRDSSWVIQWHALAMFVPSFFTGHVIIRFGAERVAAFGMLLLAAAGVSGLLGIRFENFAIGLILLGLGWNFGFIGATTMLTGCYAPSERNKAQGLNDFAIFTTTAIASLSAGQLLDNFGWNSVNIAVFPMALMALAMIGWLVTHQRARAAT
jgi:MFS family permease